MGSRNHLPGNVDFDDGIQKIDMVISMYYDSEAWVLIALLMCGSYALVAMWHSTEGTSVGILYFLPVDFKEGI